MYVSVTKLLIFPFCFAEIMGHSVDIKKLRARVGGRWDLAAELQAVKKKKREDPSGSSDSPSVPRDTSDPEHADRGPELSPSPIPEVQSPPVELADPSIEIDPTSASLVKEANLEVINLDGSPDGGPGSPACRGEPTFTDMAAHIPSSSMGQSSRGPGPAIRLDHLSITYPGVQSNWYVERKAKDLTSVYPYDAELMSKVGEVGCFEAGSVMLARCLALMQHHRRAVKLGWISAVDLGLRAKS